MSRPKLVGTFIHKELIITWKFILSNTGATLLPGLVFSFSAMNYFQLNSWEVVIGCLKSFAVFFLYGYCFDTSNQVVGYLEDLENKAHRPIPSGLLTVESTKIRFWAAMLIYTIISIQWNIGLWTLLWQITLLLHNNGGGAKWWPTKNLSMSAGIITQLTAAWELIGPIQPTVINFIIFLAFTNFFLVNVQDMRDYKGDKKIGRKTLIIVFGEQKTRTLMIICFSLMIPLVFIFFYYSFGTKANTIIPSILSNLILLIIVIRLVLKRTVEDDHRTYQTYIYWYCFLLGCTAIMF